MTLLHNKKRIESHSREAGVTLLLTLLILGSITVIVFAVASITLNEIKTSSDLGRTEPAITAAEGSTEEYLYIAERGRGTLANCSSPAVDTTFSNGVHTLSCADYYFPNPYTFNVEQNQNTSSQGYAEQDFYIYDPTNQNNPPGYTNISITMNSGSSAAVWLCDYSGSNSSCESGSPTATLVSGQSTSSALDPNTKYILIVQNQSPNSMVDSFTVNTSPQGLPSGLTTIKVTATNKGTTRKLETTVPQ